MQSGIQATRMQLRAQRMPAVTQAMLPVSTDTEVVTMALQWGQVVVTGTFPNSNGGLATKTTWGPGAGAVNPYCGGGGGPYCPPYC